MKVSRSAYVRASAAVAVLAVAALAWVVFPVRASQPPSGGYRWWQTQKQELGLTDEQASRIEAIFQASVPAFRNSKKELDQLEDTLSKMIADGVANEDAVAQQVDRVEAARSVLSKARTLMLYRMRQVLSPAQRAKLNALHEHQKERERGKSDKPKGGWGR
jgi:Spy/CpxP family protein refolding chaperone